MRRLLPVVLALVSAIASLPAEEAMAVDGQPQAVAGSLVIPPGGLIATVSKHGRVRYGPNTQSGSACMLNAGDTIEIIGPAQVPDWYVIRFPKQGKVWVSEKHLQSVDGGKRWKVTSDNVNARDDATLKGNIVAELHLGEILEDRASIRGSWHAVSIPSAIAYMHKSLISFPNAANIQAQQAIAIQTQAVWQSAQADYTQIYREISKDSNKAIGMDWTELLMQLDQVAKSHPDPNVRLEAERIHDGILLVQAKSKNVQNTGASVPVDGQMHVIQLNPPTTFGSPPDANSGSGLVVNAPTVQAPSAPVSFDAVGCVTSNTDYPKVPAPEMLLDPNSNVVAFLVPKPGSEINLGQYIWRWVGVIGATKPLDPALHGIGKPIPLIEVNTVHLVEK
jgi:uncharacterized protein YgiM (DUF1202 family)